MKDVKRMEVLIREPFRLLHSAPHSDSWFGGVMGAMVGRFRLVSHSQNDFMSFAVVDQLDVLIVPVLAINRDRRGRGLDTGLHNHNMIDAIFPAISDFKLGPIGWNTRFN